jgi:glucose-1-phosphate adenylyltransferase
MIEPGAVIENSVVGLRCRIGRNVVIRNTVLMGADYYETPETIAAHRSNGNPPLGVGEGSHIEGAIIDKNVRIGRNVRIINEQGLDNTEETPFGMIRDGIVVSAKNSTLPDDWKW